MKNQPDFFRRFPFCLLGRKSVSVLTKSISKLDPRARGFSTDSPVMTKPQGKELIGSVAHLCSHAIWIPSQRFDSLMAELASTFYLELNFPRGKAKRIQEIKVAWVNKQDMDCNPDGVIGRFEFRRG